jgi:ADP-heptose:LPS heptosyltransferase
LFVKPILSGKTKPGSKNILVINTEKLGDIILSLKFIQNIVRSESDSKIFFLVDEKYYKEIFCDGIPFKIFPLNKKKYRTNIIYRIIILYGLRKIGFGKIFNISPSRGIVNDELTLNSGAEFTTCTSNKSSYLPNSVLQKNNSAYSYLPGTDIKNELMKLRLLFKQLYENDFDFNSDETFFLQCDRPKKNLPEKYIVIAPASSDLIRNWAKENFRMLCKQLSERLPVFIIGTEEQEMILNFISKDLNNVESFAGSLKFSECVYMIKHSTLYIGLDSGFTHIAHIFKKPYVAIIGGGNFERFFPYPEFSNAEHEYHKLSCFNCEWNCIYNQPYCISLVNVDEVYSSCVKLIEGN